MSLLYKKNKKNRVMMFQHIGSGEFLDVKLNFTIH